MNKNEKKSKLEEEKNEEESATFIHCGLHSLSYIRRLHCESGSSR